jgi:hypothetical protein
VQTRRAFRPHIVLHAQHASHAPTSVHDALLFQYQSQPNPPRLRNDASSVHAYPDLQTQSSIKLLVLGNVELSGHLSHVRLSMEDKAPPVHTVHAALPLTPETEPPGHVLQAPSKEALYCPGAHGVHATRGSPANPALHMHELATARDEDCAGHGVHRSASGDDLYVPALQNAHGPPDGPTFPDLHVQVPLVSCSCDCSNKGHAVFKGYPPDPDTVHVTLNPSVCGQRSVKS